MPALQWPMDIPASQALRQQAHEDLSAAAGVREVGVGDVQDGGDGAGALAWRALISCHSCLTSSCIALKHG